MTGFLGGATPAHALAAAAIRRHLWQPGPPGPLGGRTWTMARELQIFDRLNRDVGARELIGASLTSEPSPTRRAPPV